MTTPRPHTRNALRIAASIALANLAAPAVADPFPGADLAVAKQMHAAQCVECHAKRFGGEDGSEIYTRLDRRVTTPADSRSNSPPVPRCSTSIFFPKTSITSQAISTRTTTSFSDPTTPAQ